MNITRFCNDLVNGFYGWNTACCYPVVPAPYITVLDRIHAMTTPSNLHLLNFAVSCMDESECYLEVGTWRGGTLAGALIGNAARGWAIDNEDAEMATHSKDRRADRDVWAENMAALDLADRATYISGATPAIWDAMPTLPPVGVFFYDGDKRKPDDAIGGILGALPLLAKQALIITDDLNEPPIKEALWYIRMKHPKNFIPLVDIVTPANCWPAFWNGVSVAAWVTE